ncbi:MAG TPA: ferredoxin, partial [Alphaproteobacteria bacterium]|nr:ferredoxin [Alphaproteobacteria bacterium]
DLDQARPYSIAGAPASDGAAADGQLEFFITRHPEGLASGWLHGRAGPAVRLAIRGPYGEFHLPRDRDVSVLALAGGTGLSPILSVLEGELRAGLSVPVDLMFSVRDRGEAFALERLAALERRYANFRFRVNLTRENAAPEGWMTGRIPALLATERRDLARHSVLIAGPPGFVDDCADTVKRLGASADRVQTDSFLPRAPAARPDFG